MKFIKQKMLKKTFQRPGRSSAAWGMLLGQPLSLSFDGKPRGMVKSRFASFACNPANWLVF